MSPSPILVLLSVAALVSPPVHYTLDEAGSEVSAKVPFIGLFSKSAQFPRMSGGITLSPDRPEDADLKVTLNANALTAGDGVTLRRLKGPDFFDVANHPTIVFEGQGMTMTGPKSSTINGNLTARGVTKPATLKVKFASPPAEARPGEAIELTANTSIDRRAYGMNAYSLIVGKKVNITIKARMVPG